MFIFIVQQVDKTSVSLGGFPIISSHYNYESVVEVFNLSDEQADELYTTTFLTLFDKILCLNVIKVDSEMLQ